ncbi:hypothetical protein BBJ28_00002955 [Nothophytophthora sp. Chile5]|nr:hypothetical protein BBJ28_00002955 [Nothophytophthora sp. Chile5]
MPAADGTIALVARPKPNSRARVMARKPPGQTFVALGSNRASSADTLNTNKPSFYHPPMSEEPSRGPASPAARASPRTRSQSTEPPINIQPNIVSPRREAPPQQQQEPQQRAGVRTRSRTLTRTLSMPVSRHEQRAVATVQLERSRMTARRTGVAPLQASRSRSTSFEQAASLTRSQKSPTAAENNSGSASEEEKEAITTMCISCGDNRGISIQEIEDAIASTKFKLATKTKTRDKLLKVLETTEVEVADLTFELEALRQRREYRLTLRQRREEPSSCSKSQSKSRERSSSQPHSFKRPRIVDDDDEDSDEDVTLLEAKAVVAASRAKNGAVVLTKEATPAHFWGRSDVPKPFVDHHREAWDHH